MGRCWNHHNRGQGIINNNNKQLVCSEHMNSTTSSNSTVNHPQTLGRVSTVVKLRSYKCRFRVLEKSFNIHHTPGQHPLSLAGRAIRKYPQPTPAHVQRQQRHKTRVVPYTNNVCSEYIRRRQLQRRNMLINDAVIPPTECKIRIRLI